MLSSPLANHWSKGKASHVLLGTFWWTSKLAGHTVTYSPSSLGNFALCILCGGACFSSMQITWTTLRELIYLYLLSRKELKLQKVMNNNTVFHTYYSAQPNLSKLLFSSQWESCFIFSSMTQGITYKIRTKASYREWWRNIVYVFKCATNAPASRNIFWLTDQHYQKKEISWEPETLTEITKNRYKNDPWRRVTLAKVPSQIELRENKHFHESQLSRSRC